MGSKGYRVQEITREFDVGIKFPDRPPAEDQTQENGEAPVVNGETNGAKDTIIITGKEENCLRAKEALEALVPVTEEMAVPFDFHRFIIGQRGKDVRKMMEDYDVNISIPPAEDQSNVVKITGPAANVHRAQAAMEERVKQLEGEREDRVSVSGHQIAFHFVLWVQSLSGLFCRSCATSGWKCTWTQPTTPRSLVAVELSSPRSAMPMMSTSSSQRRILRTRI